MITTATTTRQGRKDWKTGESKVITETWTQIEGTVTDTTWTPAYEGSNQGTTVHTIDAGDQTATIIITGQLTKTADGTERGLPQVGEQVRILAEATPGAQAQYEAQSFRVTVL